MQISANGIQGRQQRQLPPRCYPLFTSARKTYSATPATTTISDRFRTGSVARFYKYGWHYHFFGIRTSLANANDELLITAASIGTKKGQAVFTSAVNDVVQQHVKRVPWKTHFCPAMADPCLQIADYCTWAIQRKWEQGDSRSYNVIAHLVKHEYDSWKSGTKHYY